MWEIRGLIRSLYKSAAACARTFDLFEGRLDRVAHAARAPDLFQGKQSTGSCILGEVDLRTGEAVSRKWGRDEEDEGRT